jgi:excinuclease ABC subunit C
MPVYPQLENKLASLPPQSGVYLLKDAKDQILYIGKAKSLRNRVRSYFQASADHPVKTRLVVSKTEDFDYIITDTEKEALILENNLIKKHKPRYNVNLKDDKTYPYLKLSVAEEYPCLSIVRKVEKDNALYFGPFASANAVRETLQIIHRLFPLRKCSQRTFRKRSRPCINFQLKRCLAPCCHDVKRKDYDRVVKKVLLFLRGQDRELVSYLNAEMEEASENLNFEKAALIRDQIQAVHQTLEKQKIVSTRFIDQDIVSYFRKDSFVEVLILFIRQGRMVGNQSFPFRRVTLEDEEVIGSFVTQFYRGEKFIPREIIVPFRLENQVTIEEWLTEKRGKKTKIIVPQRGVRKNLLQMAAENARQVWENRHSEEEKILRTLEAMRQRFRLRQNPHAIECFDISNLFGNEAVGSMVRFENGEPVKQKYRRYKIKTVNQADDYGMMQEIIKRRLSRGRKEQSLPNLIVVDGGKGQLGVACHTLKALGIEDVDVIGLAKSRFQDQNRTPEKIFIPGQKDPLILTKHHSVLHLLQRIRDESHRFAIAYHRKLRQKKQTESVLDDIPGIGPTKKQYLLKHFGSLKRIRSASLEEVLAVPSISKTNAQDIVDFFHNRVVV